MASQTEKYRQYLLHSNLSQVRRFVSSLISGNEQ